MLRIDLGDPLRVTHLVGLSPKNDFKKNSDNWYDIVASTRLRFRLRIRKSEATSWQAIFGKEKPLENQGLSFLG